ncbi:hypothetical protein GCM10009554_73400 [Kribbella koreensis]|uniref:DUF4829 domain-containing protein n=2 Tax=Kribbella TaxID=182639 RepID=A0ABP6YUJ2_9ACTN
MREKEARTLLEAAVSDVAASSPPIDTLLARGRRSRNHHRALTAVGAVLIVLAFIGIGTTVGTLNDHTTVSSQPLPASATPEEVIRAYVAAKNARDKATALSYVTPRRAESLLGSEGGFFGDRWPFGLRRAKPITDLRLEPPDSKYPRSGGGSMADGWQQAVFVRATYQRNNTRTRTQWGYLLVRNTTTERWSIADEGPA